MKAVDQTTFGWPGGNCFSACVASILELPIESVPYFMGGVVDGEGWWQRFVRWCRENNVQPRYHGDPNKPPSGYSILSGHSPRNPENYHAVVALDGLMVHDPHAGDRRGVTDVLDWITVEWIR